MAKRTAILYQCDNPSCLVEREHDSGDPALGIHIQRGFVANEWGGRALEKTYACSVACIGPAVEHMLNETVVREY